MPLPRTLNQYFDVEQVLLAARQAGGAEYELPTPGSAVAWRQRAYYYRKLLSHHDLQAHGNNPAYKPTTPWDDMNLTIDPENKCIVRITFATLRGQLRSLGGETLTPPQPGTPVAAPAESDDPLLSQALEIAKGLESE